MRTTTVVERLREADPDRDWSAISLAAVLRKVGIAGKLAAGYLEVGGQLTLNRRDAGQRPRATVLADGRLSVNGLPFTSSSAAARSACGGTSLNGWEAWRCERDNRLLAVKRERVRGHRTR